MSIVRWLMLFVAGCLATGAAIAGDRDAVNAVFDSIEKAHESRNIELLGAQYSDELLLIGENAGSSFSVDKAKTLAAVRDRLWKSADLLTRKVTGRRIAVRNDLAILRAGIVDSYKDGRTESSEQYVLCVKRDSRWTVCFGMPALMHAEAVVKAVLPGSPADKAGVKAEDAIAAINGEDIPVVLLDSGARGFLESEDGSDVSLTLRRSGADVQVKAPSGLKGATTEVVLVPSGSARFVPDDERHPVKDILRNEIQALRTGDTSAYGEILGPAGFFSYRREADGHTGLVNGQNALKVIGKQLDESRSAIKPSTVELQSVDVIATPCMAVAAATVRATARDGSELQVPTRLHVYLKSGVEWFLVADLVERFRLAPGSGHVVQQSVEDTRKAEREVKGRMVGIGVKLSGRSDGLLIEGVIPGAPAEKMGLKKGEMIVSIDGKPTKGMSVAAAVNAITGEEGTEVALEVAAPSGERRTVRIVRATIKLTGVEARLLGGRIGYMEITAFNAETAPAAREAFANTLASPQAGGIILDLRGNGGGLYPEVVRVAGMLIDGDTPTILWMVRQAGKEPVAARASSPALTRLPCVVLIDAKTGGAAELLAEALREHSRATLVGAKSAGEAVMKQRVANADGTSRVEEIGDFLFPKTGRTGKDGVVPDVVAPKDATPEQVIELGKKTLKKLMTE